MQGLWRVKKRCWGPWNACEKRESFEGAKWCLLCGLPGQAVKWVFPGYVLGGRQVSKAQLIVTGTKKRNERKVIGKEMIQTFSSRKFQALVSGAHQVLGLSFVPANSPSRPMLLFLFTTK